MNEIFFMVYLQGKNNPAFKHNTMDAAREEAKRLSKKHNLPAFVLQSIIVVTPTVTVEESLMKIGD